MNADQVQHGTPVSNGGASTFQIGGSTLFVNPGGFIITLQAVKHVGLDLEHHGISRCAGQATFGKLQAGGVIFLVVVHPDQGRKEQGPEAARHLGGAIQNGKVFGTVVGLEGNPTETLVDIVGVNGKERAGLQFLGIPKALAAERVVMAPFTE